MKHQSLNEAWPTAQPLGRVEALTEPLLLHPMKRLLDILIASVLIVAASPLLCLIALWVRLDSPGPAIFSQTRCGLGGRTFRCYKFRTMVSNADVVLKEILANDPVLAAEWAADQKLRNDPRVTRIGAFLRKTSLDELPQLWNILKGEMSIVGPRPIVVAERIRYGEDIMSYDRVRPGVTGLWQVSGRNDTTYAERVALDVEYVETWSFFSDLEILLKTGPAIFLRRGAY